MIKSFFEQTRPAAGKGAAYFELNWTILYLFVPYLVYLLGLLQVSYLYWGLLVYSVTLIVVYCLVMSRFKDHMAYESNPFDFVKVELMLLFNVVMFFGLSYFFLSKTAETNFNRALNLVDGVYFSFVTTATIGYGDIHPVSILGKGLVIFQICVGVWFFVTVVPIAVADQAERIRQFRIGRQHFAESLKKAYEKGEIVKAPGLKPEEKTK